MDVTEFVERWHRRAAESADCFDRFFSAWIALVIEARRHLKEHQLSDPDGDRVALVRYFEERADSIVGVLGNLPEHTVWLAHRKGTETGKPILDVLPSSRKQKHLRRDFDELALVWAGKATREPRWIAGKAAEMLNHIRNNMFHGVKAPGDADDRKLLEKVNAILLAVLEARK